MHKKILQMSLFLAVGTCLLSGYPCRAMESNRDWDGEYSKYINNHQGPYPLSKIQWLEMESYKLKEKELAMTKHLPEDLVQYTLNKDDLLALKSLRKEQQYLNIVIFQIPREKPPIYEHLTHRGSNSSPFSSISSSSSIPNNNNYSIENFSTKDYGPGGRPGQFYYSERNGKTHATWYQPDDT